MSRLYESAVPRKKHLVRCATCGYRFSDPTRRHCAQCLAKAAVQAGKDPAPLLALATEKERAELHILRPLSSEEHSKDWRDLGDQFYSPSYIDNRRSRGVVSRYLRASRRTRPTLKERRAAAQDAARIQALKKWRVREAALPRTVTDKQRAAMKAHALGETIPAIAARLRVGPDAIKDRIRRGEHTEKRHQQNAVISTR